MTNPLFGRDIISVAELNQAEIDLIFDTAAKIKQAPMPTLLQGKTMASCFFEASTRTRLSFEAAMLKLGGGVFGFSDSKNTSAKKGESLHDAIKVIASYADVIVLRHPQEGAARLATEVSDKPIINGGDGSNRHPSQTLLDLYTIRECQGRLTDLNIAFVGDLKYGRTVHSLAQACATYNTNYFFVSPEMLMMPDNVCDTLTRHGANYTIHRDINEVLDKVDIIYMTRMQKERFDEAEFKHLMNQYSLTADMLQSAKPNMRIMHPLPRVDEIDVDVDATPHAYYFEQAENGLYVRQAMLSLMLNKELV